MKIEIRSRVSGLRNGEAWPSIGSVVDWPDHEAIKYCKAGLAVPVVDTKEERAVAPKSEKRAPAKRGRPTKTKS